MCASQSSPVTCILQNKVKHTTSRTDTHTHCEPNPNDDRNTLQEATSSLPLLSPSQHNDHGPIVGCSLRSNSCPSTTVRRRGANNILWAGNLFEYHHVPKICSDSIPTRTQRRSGLLPPPHRNHHPDLHLLPIRQASSFIGDAPRCYLQHTTSHRLVVRRTLGHSLHPRRVYRV